MVVPACEYVLHAMNRDRCFGYVRKLGLDQPTSDVELVLRACESQRVRTRRAAAEKFLKLLQSGNFGAVVLDDLTHEYEPFVFKDSHFGQRNFGERETWRESERSWRTER